MQSSVLRLAVLAVEQEGSLLLPPGEPEPPSRPSAAAASAAEYGEALLVAHNTGVRAPAVHRSQAAPLCVVPACGTELDTAYSRRAHLCTACMRAKQLALPLGDGGECTPNPTITTLSR